MLNKFLESANDYSAIGLIRHDPKTAVRYFCTPENAAVFASCGVDGIHYCIMEDGTAVTVAPMPISEDYVIPTAENFTDFLRLVLALHGTFLFDQIPVFSKDKLEAMLCETIENESVRQREMYKKLAEEFGITPMESPVDYVLSVIKNGDMSKVKFSKEYYETLGLECE